MQVVESHDDDYEDLIDQAIEFANLYSLDKSLRRPNSSIASSATELHIFRCATRYLACKHLLRHDRNRLAYGLVQSYTDKMQQDLI